MVLHCAGADCSHSTEHHLTRPGASCPPAPPPFTSRALPLVQAPQHALSLVRRQLPCKHSAGPRRAAIS